MLFGPLRKDDATDNELVAIDDMEAGFERRITRSYREFMRSVRSPNFVREARRHVGDISWLIGHVDQKIQPTGFLLNKLFEEAGAKEAKTISRKLGRKVEFDPLDPATMAVQKGNRLDFINEFNRKQRLVSRATLVEARRRRLDVRDTFDALQASVGLTAHQENIVNNYRRLVERGSSESLNRVLRDRRYDGVLNRAINNGKVLSTAQIERMTKAYREKFIAYRAANIARTEALKAANNARYMAHKQAWDQTGRSESDITRMWHSMRDNKVRDTHEELDGQEVEGMDEPFESESGALLMYPGDPNAPAEEVINCRCFVTYHFNRMAKAYWKTLKPIAFNF